MACVFQCLFADHRFPWHTFCGECNGTLHLRLKMSNDHLAGPKGGLLSSGGKDSLVVRVD